MAHLYIHIPFCDSKCLYCPFNSFAGYKNKTFQDYFSALKKQLIYELGRFDIKHNTIQTVYIGGGTPSCVKSDYYADIFKLLTDFLHKNVEITVEANPNSASKVWLSGMYNLGVNRLSLGVQSFDSEKLRFLGRIHSAKSSQNAVLRAKEIGFENISIDLIYDTHFDTVEFLSQEIQIALSLPINHLSAYSLTIEPGSAFEGKAELKHENIQNSHVLFEKMKNAGFEHYEISNFGKIRSQHNSSYWLGHNYIGVGAGAVGFFDNMRLYPHTNIEQYIQEPLWADNEMLSEDDMRFERIFLGLRSAIGVDLQDIKKEHSHKIDILKKSKKIHIKKGRIYNRDLLLADEIALYLDN